MKTFETLSKTVAFHAATSSVDLGNAGERLAIALFRDSGFLAEKENERFKGDIRVISPETGEITKVEVKIARQSEKSGTYQFCLNKRGFTSCSYSEFCLLMAVFRGGVACYLIPCVEIEKKQKVTITSHPNKYRGWMRKYQLRPNELIKFTNVYGVKNRYA